MKLIKQLVVIAICFLGTVHAQAATSKIGIIVFDGFLTSDVTAPIEVFGAATSTEWFSDYEVVLISTTKRLNVKSEEGLSVIADSTIYETLELDVLMVPSAYDMTPFLSNSDLVSFIASHGNKASWIASNCSGAFLLGEAGLLNGKKATTWAGGEAELAKAYPEIHVQYDQNVVVDGRIVTSNGGPISYQASLALLEKMSSADHAQAISNQIQFPRLSRAFSHSPESEN